MTVHIEKRRISTVIRKFLLSGFFGLTIEYGTFGEGSQISTNQKLESSVFSILIGLNLRPCPENTILYYCD